MAPTVAVHSIFRVLTKLDGVNAKSGTGFVVDEDENGSYVMTAGHVCNLSMKIDGLDLNFEPPGIKTFTLVNRESKAYDAEEVYRSGKYDLCVLKVKGRLARPLPIAEKPPEWGDEIMYVGAPRGFIGDGVSMLFKGFYSGKDIVSIFTSPGASGSPLFTKSGVFGVLVAKHPEADQITVMESLQNIKIVLKAAQAQ